MRVTPLLNIASLAGKDLATIATEAVNTFPVEMPLMSGSDKVAYGHRMVKQRRAKADYRLFPLYQSIKQMEDECAIIINEILVKEEDGSWTQTEVYKILEGTSKQTADMLKQIEVLWLPTFGQVDQLKAGWIKEKVIQTRFSRRGQEYIEKLQVLSDNLLSLSTLCINIPLLINDLTKGLEDV